MRTLARQYKLSLTTASEFTKYIRKTEKGQLVSMRYLSWKFFNGTFFSTCFSVTIRIFISQLSQSPYTSSLLVTSMYRETPWCDRAYGGSTAGREAVEDDEVTRSAYMITRREQSAGGKKIPSVLKRKPAAAAAAAAMRQQSGFNPGYLLFPMELALHSRHRRSRPCIRTLKDRRGVLPFVFSFCTHHQANLPFPLPQLMYRAGPRRPRSCVCVSVSFTIKRTALTRLRRGSLGCCISRCQ